jgi:magnesium transporter
MLRREVKALVAQLPMREYERIVFFRGLQPNQQGFLLLALSTMRQHDLVGRLTNEEILNILHTLDPDKATDLLHIVPHQRRAGIIEKLSGDLREKVEYLLKFNPKSAAGMMSLDYVEVERDVTFHTVGSVVRRHERRTGRFPAILAVDEGQLLGELPGHAFALHRGDERIGKHLRRVPKVRFDADESQVMEVFKGHPHDKIVVLDSEESILGIIYRDDILPLLENQETRSLSDFVGVSQEEDVFDSAFSKVQRRSKWLIFNLAAAFLAAAVVGYYDNIITAYVLLAVYMPVVAAMGSNAGTQTLAVVVRGIAMRDLNMKNARRVVMGELTAAAWNGLIIGALIFFIAAIVNHQPMTGFVIGVAVFFSFLFACFCGAIIPLLMRQLGKDPATSATVFITTITDVVGFFILLWLASRLL